MLENSFLNSDYHLDMKHQSNYLKEIEGRAIMKKALMALVCLSILALAQLAIGSPSYNTEKDTVLWDNGSINYVVYNVAIYDPNWLDTHGFDYKIILTYPDGQVRNGGEGYWYDGGSAHNVLRLPYYTEYYPTRMETAASAKKKSGPRPTVTVKFSNIHKVHADGSEIR
jgi:hypothetical protein